MNDWDHSMHTLKDKTQTSPLAHFFPSHSSVRVSYGVCLLTCTLYIFSSYTIHTNNTLDSILYLVNYYRKLEIMLSEVLDQRCS